MSAFPVLRSAAASAFTIRALGLCRRLRRRRRTWAAVAGRLGLRRHGRLRFLFDQDIYRIPDQTLVASAVVTGVVIREGRPVAPDEVVQALEGYAARRREQQ